MLLSAAIATEVASTLALRGSEGFSRLAPSIITIVGYIASFILLALVKSYANRVQGAGIHRTWNRAGRRKPNFAILWVL